MVTLALVAEKAAVEKVGEGRRALCQAVIQAVAVHQRREYPATVLHPLNRISQVA